MMRHTSLRHRPRRFLAFTSLTVEEFDRLVAELRDDWMRLRTERLLEEHPLEKRKRKMGGGAKPKLGTFEDQLLLTLIWARLYPVDMTPVLGKAEILF